MTASKAEALITISSAVTYGATKRIAEMALLHRLPSCHPFRETVAAGGLVSLGPDARTMAKQGAEYASKIIKGSKPGDLPVEQPARYELHINLKTAKTLEINLPASLLARADEVIE
jgi:putative tryptophan/tyrosine transport system substrate-binding protein